MMYLKLADEFNDQIIKVNYTKYTRLIKLQIT